MLSINTALENVLVNLQSQREILVNKLQDEVPFYKSDMSGHKNKSERSKKESLNTKRHSYKLPEIRGYFSMF